MNRGRVDLRELLNGVINDLSCSGNPVGQIDLSVADDCAFPELDKSLLSLAVSAVLSNAIKFSYPGTRITMRAVLSGAEYEIQVGNYGVGVSQPDQGRIFDPFFRGINTELVPGVGLGLTIARDAVHLMGGRLTVQSLPGDETIFSIVMPKTGKPPHPESASAAFESPSTPGQSTLSLSPQGANPS